MRIILARHGDAVGQKGKFHGITNEPLTTAGRMEAYRLAEELRKYHPAIIYYSPIKRTRDTARILASELYIPLRAAPELHPLDLGKFVGKSLEAHTDAVKYYIAHPDERIPGGGTVNEWAKKYLPYFERYFQNKTNQSIIFMTHGRNILLTEAHLAQDGLAPNFDKNVLLNNKHSTEHGGYAIATPPDHFRIVTPKHVKSGTS